MTIPKPFSYALMGDIEVLILAVLVRGDLVQCEVSWVLNGDRKTAWVELPEIAYTKAVEIGFREDTLIQ